MINLIVALRSEARPLIEAFGLAPLVESPVPRHYEGGGLSLAVSGIGKTAARSCMSALIDHRGVGSDQSWLNVGLAGHQSHSVGSAFLVDTVRDAYSGQEWRLPLPAQGHLPLASVVTVDEPETEYPEDVLYDMEASAFVSAAARVSELERICVLKVVSDNPSRPTELLTAELATQLMRAQVETIDRVIGALAKAGWKTGPGETEAASCC